MRRPHLQLRYALTLVLFACAAINGFTFEAILNEIDELHEFDRNEEVFSLLDRAEAEAASQRDEAELAWRRARALLSDTDVRHRSGELGDSEARERLSRGEEAGRRAIELAPDIAEAHFWTGSNIGLNGRIRGVLRALSSASGVRDFAAEALRQDPDLKEAHFLLGVLYRELPGGIISFGNSSYAVSFGRRAVELHEREYEAGAVPFRYFDFYLELAESLWDRNWSGSRRSNRMGSIAESYRNEEAPFEKGKYYEGTAAIPDRGDREEARELLRFVIRELREAGTANTRQELALERANELNDEWN